MIATARSLVSMQTLQTQGIETLELDVTSSSSIQNVKARVEKITCGILDVLVNDALSSRGIVETVQAFLPLLIAANKHQYAQSPTQSISWASRIVLVSSITAILPMPFHAAYNAMKSALLQYGNTLKIEVESFRIKVITIHAGRVTSRLLKETDRHSLPQGSIYGSIRKVDPTPTAEFAIHAVSHTVKKNAGAFFWYGGQTWMTSMMDTFFPRTMWASAHGYQYMTPLSSRMP
ncbi:hypothetical protein EUX98_g2693 [Antrodiella citrinella]|uniref:Ketoreductase (KR) domain-containing protein n=1 Tax=Antrodiella citrinella TaxID=2447956 RepID=A0A4V3XJ30_9APHY|nr:hypothetical protein EUX98_g2693 [Antrodiella citrinella]